MQTWKEHANIVSSDSDLAAVVAVQLMLRLHLSASPSLDMLQNFSDEKALGLIRQLMAVPEKSLMPEYI